MGQFSITTNKHRAEHTPSSLILYQSVREVKEFATILAQMSTQRLTVDLDDGVKTNYLKYYPLVEPIKGLDAKEE